MGIFRKTWIYDPTNDYGALVDSIAGMLATIDARHQQVHAGNYFDAFVYTASGTTIHIAFKTPVGTTRAHMRFEFAVAGAATMTVKEGPSWTTNTGTIFVPVNQWRKATPDASVLLEDTTATPAWTANGVLTGVTALTGGTTIKTVHVFAAETVIVSREMVLEPDETYAVELTAGSAQAMELRLDWYEHADAN